MVRKKSNKPGDKERGKHRELTEAQKRSRANLRPPWKKGDPSPNPKGRPPNPFSLTNLHKVKMNEQIPARMLEALWRMETRTRPETPVPKEVLNRKITWGQAITDRNFFMAMSPRGDNIIKIVWEFIEGKPTQKIAGADGGPLQVRVGKLDRKRMTDDELRRHESGKMTLEEYNAIVERIKTEGEE